MIDRPQVVAIIGSSGAGKSTLIRCINRLVEPTAGRILLNGRDIVTLDRRGLRAARRRIGMIFQEFNLVERLTVMQNVLSGRLGYVGLFASLRYRFPPADIRAAFELLDRVGLAGYHDQRADALVGRAAAARRHRARADATPRAAAGRRADGEPRPEDIAPDHAADRRTGDASVRTPALVNLHDVALARVVLPTASSASRPARSSSTARRRQLTDDVLTLIYGAEDWTLAPGQADADADIGSATVGSARAAKSAATTDIRPDLPAQP